ncbi:helix-turn-helix domain-containing protein [Mycobacterium yunnanensis]|uniref:Helix-turn-helix domain-containing protein n=1 Tax=Mycobacterium yunnanensis TaxID=368477 RepID=A0A9X2Z8K9_9MYCO|nr:helix-turn-helix transcriptional regulator [Mycobacterium yunnanensis]MCV7424604.1 helix-turn-helix domain-containing protein [Mycobacterium yunnanensis]
MSASVGVGPLGEFLAARRSRVKLAQAGVAAAGRRRVPGLRREELADLAGISAVYYARLEQGTSRNASPEVLESLSRALGLADDERRHLLDLAALSRGRRPVHADDERLAPALAQVLTALGDAPAVILGQAMDVLAWNRAGHALTAQHLEFECVGDVGRRPNVAVNVFLDPRTAALYADWPRKSRAVVGHLRMVAATSSASPRVTAVIDELRTCSAAFAALWADHAVGTCTGGSYVIDHPVVGRCAVHQQTLTAPGADGQSLVTFTPADAAAERSFGCLTAA